MSPLRFSSVVVLALLLMGCAATSPTDYTTYQRSTALTGDIQQDELPVKVTNPRIEFRGIALHDDRVNSLNLLYSDVGGAGGIGAQIVMHATSVRAARDRKLEELREKADLALAPLKADLEGLEIDELRLASVPGRFLVGAEGEDSSSEFFVRSYPIFFVSDNLESISITNVISLHQTAGSKTATLYQNLVEVILDAEDLAGGLENAGRDGLMAMIHKLYAESMILALDDVAEQLQEVDLTARNFRFHQGERLRVERGSKVEQGCKSTTIRNLRGWLIRYPASGNTTCSEQVAASK